MIPVMKAEIVQRQEALNLTEQYVKSQEEYLQLLEDIEAGKIDPLAHMKPHSKYILAPPSAVYKPKLSRWESVHETASPAAVFSYGIEASEALRTFARGGEAAAIQLVTWGDIYEGPNGKKIKAVYDEFVSFYTAKGFANFISEAFVDCSCVSPDGGTTAFFFHLNVLAKPKNVEAIPDGPILILAPRLSSSADEQAQPQRSPALMSKETALRLAGMSEEEYGEYAGALMMARNDAADPSAIDPSTLELGVEGAPVDPEMAKTLKEMKVFYEIRRHNVLMYKKYAAVLDPLFAANGQ
jgi:hypothetical protein